MFIVKYHELLWSFIRRDILTRYRGSFLGIMWSFLNPLFMLLLYTFVFSVILGVRFPGSTAITGYSINLFCALIPWLAFSETIGRSPSLILSNVNLVKKTVFPLEILPVMAVSTGFIHGLISLLILFVAVIIANGHLLYMTIFLLPIVMIPQILLTVGLAWMLSSMGVFVRDLGELVRLFLTAWMFLTPIMYPMEVIPEKYRGYAMINPMAVIAEGYRALIIKGVLPDWKGLLWVALLGLFMGVMGYIWFIKTKKIFADVI